MMKRNPRKNHHLRYFTAVQTDEMKNLGIEASVNPYYLWVLADKYSEYELCKKRARNLVDMKLFDRSIPMSFHSDFVMEPAEPLNLV